MKTTRDNLRPDIVEVLWDQFCKVIKYQRVNNQITVTMTFDDYLSLWTKNRIETITKKIAVSDDALRYYFAGPFRPVCSWVTREARIKGGTMRLQDAKIRSADDSKKLFQFHAGDRHSPQSKARIGQAKRGTKQTPEQIAKRTARRLATMAAKKAHGA